MKFFNKLKELVEPFLDPAPKDTPENHVNQVVRDAAKHLPKSIKEMSPADLQRTINKLNQPNKWAITKTMATGKIQKHGVPGGLGIMHTNDTPQMREKNKKKIAKGCIQVTPEREYKSSKTPEWLKKQEELKQQKFSILKGES